jgi:dTDP-4-dehydrorhamnose reductase
MNILILGITSWVGVCLSRELQKHGFSITGTTRGNPHFSLCDSAAMEVCRSPVDYLSLVDEGDFSVVINLLRGEETSNFLVHKSVIKICSEKDVLYCYASSALALDGYPFDTILTEQLHAKSNSDYGIFKALCEEEIQKEKNLRSLILRFSSIQGWPAHKLSRNATFFHKIIAGESVFVDRGIIQNRLYDADFVSMIVRLLLDRKVGIYHLGAADYSEEYNFLSQLADRFGFDKNLVRSGKDKNINANVVAKKFFEEYPDYHVFQKDTIAQLIKNAPGWLR